VRMPILIAAKNTHIDSCATCQLRPSRGFCNLGASALEEFNAIGVTCLVPKGYVLFRESTTCAHVFVLCTGAAKLSCTSKAGKNIILQMARPGDVLGLGAIIADGAHEATAETIEPTQFKRVGKLELVDFLKRHSEASQLASRTLSLDNNRALLSIRRHTLPETAAGKLAAVLLELGRRCGQCSAEMRFPMPLTHEELASLSGVSRETVTRTLRRFQDDQLIQIAGYSVRILSPSGLENLSS
jgi:CRP/FNR family transcriptional regulator, cyclic AMP receptor protein